MELTWLTTSSSRDWPPRTHTYVSCMYINTYIHIYVCVYTHIHIHTHTHVSCRRRQKTVCTFVCTCAYMTSCIFRAFYAFYAWGDYFVCMCILKGCIKQWLLKNLWDLTANTCCTRVRLHGVTKVGVYVCIRMCVCCHVSVHHACVCPTVMNHECEYLHVGC